jgi:hypothetical protein
MSDVIEVELEGPPVRVHELPHVELVLPDGVTFGAPAAPRHHVQAVAAGEVWTAASFVRFFLLLVALGMVLAVAVNVLVDPLGLVHRDPAGSLSEESSYRIWKRQLVDGLAAPPQVLLLGSSTMRDIDPQLIRTDAHRTAFNASVVGGSPLDAWVLQGLVHDRYPHAAPHVVYGVDIDLTFRDLDPSPALLRDPALRGQLGARDLVDVGSTVLRPYLTLAMTRTSLRMAMHGVQPPAPRPADTMFRADGFRLLDPYRHTHLRRRLPRETARFADLVYRNGDYRVLAERPRRYLERMIVAANAAGDTPTFVVMPVQPWAHAQLGPLGQDARHAVVLGWLHRMQQRHRLRVVDLADPTSFAGTAEGFRDNVHLAPQNAGLLVRELAARRAFDPVTR